MRPKYVVDPLLSDETLALVRLRGRSAQISSQEKGVDGVAAALEKYPIFCLKKDRSQDGRLGLKATVLDISRGDFFRENVTIVPKEVLIEDLLEEAPISCHTRIIFFQEWRHSFKHLRALHRNFSIPDPFWDFYCNGSFGSRRSKLFSKRASVEYDDIWLQICQPIMIFNKETRKTKRYITSPSFLLKWRRTSCRDCYASFPDVYFFCLETDATPEGLQDAISYAYSDSEIAARLKEDPYGLFSIVLTQWTRWNLDLFYFLEAPLKYEEMKCDSNFESLGNGEFSPPDLSLLHALAKYVIQSLDTTAVAVESQASLHKSHLDLIASRGVADAESSQFVKAALQYHLSKCTGITARLKNLEARINNQIKLSSNLLRRHETRLGQKDTHSVTTISILTLGFLPPTAVATIFSMPFFYCGHDHDSRLRISPDFKIFWAVCLPLTFTILAIWYWLRIINDECSWVSKINRRLHLLDREEDVGKKLVTGGKHPISVSGRDIEAGLVE